MEVVAGVEKKSYKKFKTKNKKRPKKTERIELLERKILQGRLQTLLVLLVRSDGSNSVSFTFHLVLQQTGADV